MVNSKDMNASFNRKKANQDGDFPTNQLSRFQFFELIVKMSLGKFGNMDDKI